MITLQVPMPLMVVSDPSPVLLHLQRRLWCLTGSMIIAVGPYHATVCIEKNIR